MIFTRCAALALLLLLVINPARALVILQYHHISDDTPPSTSTSPELFQRHLEMIEASGFRVVGLTAVTEPLRRGEAPPADAVLISFDDSYLSIYETAFPMLKKRDWPFVVFVDTGPVAQKKPGHMSWAQLKEMAENGADIANHSVNHPHMVRRPQGTNPATWQASIQEEILSAEQAIHKGVGQSHRVLAFPYGEFDASLLARLQQLDFLGTSQASGAVRAQDALTMPRFPMGGRYGNPDRFMVKLKSLPMPIASLRILDHDGKELQDGVLTANITRPVLELSLSDNTLHAGLACYASGQIEAISKQVDNGVVQFRADKPLPAGRSRYNCTARNPSGRFHWFSMPFLKPRDDGSWPPE